jgi:hypothetical protein
MFLSLDHTNADAHFAGSTVLYLRHEGLRKLILGDIPNLSSPPHLELLRTLLYLPTPFFCLDRSRKTIRPFQMSGDIYKKNLISQTPLLLCPL